MTVTKVVTVVKTKKGPHTHKKKGELMENDQDAMEVIFHRRFILNKSHDSLVYGTIFKNNSTCVQLPTVTCVLTVLLRGGGGGSTDSSHWVPDETEESSGAC